MNNYESLISRIAESSKFSIEEIERKIEAKRAKLSGLVSKEGAAQIVAAELGINFDQERLKIRELVHGMRRANVLGKVLQIFPIREYNKNGRQGKVANLRIADDSGNTRAVLWDTNHISLIESGKINEGDFVEISNASVRENEVHLGSFSDLKKSKEKIENVIEEKIYSMYKITDLKTGSTAKIRAFIVQSFEPRYFEVNEDTGKKISEEERASEIKIKKRALLNLVLDDGSDIIRAVMFGDIINKLGFSNEEIFSVEEFKKKKGNLLGEELIFSGNLRENKFTNQNEFTIEGIEMINPEELVKELEAIA